MSIKDKFKELKDELLVSMVSKNSRDYEFCLFDMVHFNNHSSKLLSILSRIL